MSSRNRVILVDEQDNQIGIKEKLAAHEKNLLHRAFSIMLYRKVNGELEFLLQKRALGKYHCPGLWTNSCCSHPQPGEDLIASAQQRLLEELVDIDLEKLNLNKAGSFIYQADFDNGLSEHELDHVFIAEYPHTPCHFNASEIAECKWFAKSEIEKAYQTKPDDFTPWFYQVYQICSDN